MRLEADYRDRFIRAGATAFNAWANGTSINIDADFGGASGPVWGARVTYARRNGPFGLIGAAIPFKTLAEAERELRLEMESMLEVGPPPRKLGRK